ncbi:hypothetical protein PENTCL1PPCAC_20511, partial [Pristionchus entomophagus]
VISSLSRFHVSSFTNCSIDARSSSVIHSIPICSRLSFTVLHHFLQSFLTGPLFRAGHIFSQRSRIAATPCHLTADSRRGMISSAHEESPSLSVRVRTARVAV